MPKLTTQTINGKAFEFALLNELYKSLKTTTNIIVIENAQYITAQNCFNSFSDIEKVPYKICSSKAVGFILDIEPKLSNEISVSDILQLEIISDKKGQIGDVRDVLASRPLQKWEIGISAKNNHRAVKHSRLSNKINFGEKWLGISCSTNYFEEIKTTFDELEILKKQSKSMQTWESLGDYHSSVYLPILNAFKKELLRLDEENPGIVASRLTEYLIGKQDFYKIIKGSNQVEIQAYNLHGSLSQAFNDIKPSKKIGKLKLPTRLVEVVYENNSTTTLLVSLNEGWQISFRIHNASSRIEASLKFDINLVSSPRTLFTHHI